MDESAYEVTLNKGRLSHPLFVRDETCRRLTFSHVLYARAYCCLYDISTEVTILDKKGAEKRRKCKNSDMFWEISERADSEKGTRPLETGR